MNIFQKNIAISYQDHARTMGYIAREKMAQSVTKAELWQIAEYQERAAIYAKEARYYSGQGDDQ